MVQNSSNLQQSCGVEHKTTSVYEKHESLCSKDKLVYCVRCRAKTICSNPKMVKAKNGRAMVKGNCKICGCKQNKFV